MAYVINIDGGTRGNPGPSALGVVIHTPNKGKVEIAEFIENATNNEAEYSALIRALEWLRDNKVTGNVLIQSDSMLIVNQVAGTWQVKQESLMGHWALAYGLYTEVADMVAKLQLVHVPREENKEADALCNRVMDERGVKFERRERLAK
jgi:ribonuclease HI